MKLTQDTVEVNRSQEFEEISYDIPEEGRPMVLHILRSQVYSDKVFASIRETVANALDANVENGKRDVPITVTIPNAMEPSFKVRDYGKGLSEHDIKNLYRHCGVSSKRDSDDYIGALGIGKMAPLSYGDSFLLVSYQNGIKTTYNSYLNETKEGKLARMSIDKTDEPDGLEIIIPVKKTDYDEFQRKAFNLFKNFKVKPEIKGVEEYEIPDWHSEVMLCGSDWRLLTKNAGQSIAIMGTPYPINLDSIEDKLDETQINLLKSGIELEFNIGELQMVASREALEYSDRTVAAIKKKLTRIVPEIVEQIQDKIVGAANYWEACLAYRDLFYGSDSIGNRLDDIISNNIEWNGIKITGYLRIKDYIGIQCVRFAKEHVRRRRYGSGLSEKIKRSEITDHIEVDEDKCVLMFNDVGARGIGPRINKYMAANSDIRKVYLINFNSYSEQAVFENATKIQLSTLDKISNYERDKIITSGGGSYQRVPHHFAKGFKVKMDALGRYHSDNKEYLEVAALDRDGSGVYFNIDRFEMSGSFVGGFHNLGDMVTRLTSLGITVPDLYCVKNSLIDKLGKGWIRFDAWLRGEIEGYLAKNDLEIDYANYIEHSLSYGNGVTSVFSKLSLVETLGQGHLLFSLNNTYKDIQESGGNDKIQRFKSITDEMSISIKPGEPIAKLNDLKGIVLKSYPLIQYLSSCPNEEVINYIKMVDKSLEK